MPNKNAFDGHLEGKGRRVKTHKLKKLKIACKHAYITDPQNIINGYDAQGVYSRERKDVLSLYMVKETKLATIDVIITLKEDLTVEMPFNKHVVTGTAIIYKIPR